MKKKYYYKNTSGKIKIIKSGFCWPAFLFGGLWALVNRIWNVFFCLLVIEVGVNIFDIGVKGPNSIGLSLFSLFLTMIQMFVLGKIGNAIHMSALDGAKRSRPDNFSSRVAGESGPRHDSHSLQC